MAKLHTLDSHVRPPNFRRNADTELFQGYNPSSTTDLRQAYAFARGLAKMQPTPDAQRGPGHRIVWVRGGSFASVTLGIALGKPLAARAVGGACGANPIPVLVPCHRVLAANGRLGGFSGGLDWKRRLLAIEDAN